MNESEDIRTTVEFLQTARFCSKVDLGSLLIDTAKSALGQTQVRDSKKIGGGYVTFFDRAIFGLERFSNGKIGPYYVRHKMQWVRSAIDCSAYVIRFVTRDWDEAYLKVELFHT